MIVCVKNSVGGNNFQHLISTKPGKPAVIAQFLSAKYLFRIKIKLA